MTRFKLHKEVDRQKAIIAALENAPVVAYPPPPSMAKRLTSAGFKISRQGVRLYYAAWGIKLDRESGLWLNKEKRHEQK